MVVISAKFDKTAVMALELAQIAKINIVHCFFKYFSMDHHCLLA